MKLVLSRSSCTSLRKFLVGNPRERQLRDSAGFAGHLNRREFGTRSKNVETKKEELVSSTCGPRQPEAKIRTNPVKIQMLSSSLRSQIFKVKDDHDGSGSDASTSPEKLEAVVAHLTHHGLWDKLGEGSVIPEVDFNLPKLLGNNLDEHFRNIATQQCEPYLSLAKELAASSIPTPPNQWNFEYGWTKYNKDGTFEKIDFPPERALVFDVEVLVTASQLPILATAVSSNAWYSWCSKYLAENQVPVGQRAFSDDLIPLETKCEQSRIPSGEWEPRIVIGHNISYDRARIKEQYYVQGTKLRFLDTMSLHIASSGLTGLQRALLIVEKTGSKRKDAKEAKARSRGPIPKDWMRIGSMNNLADVYQLYCRGPPLPKEEREIFVKGTLSDVKDNFQNLMSYCSRDVQATKDILSVLLPMFLKRSPHPVTFAGMLEMGFAYLPVNRNWEKYLENAQTVHDDLEQELKHLLMRLANDACEYLHEDRYKRDPWLWDLDWSVKKRKTKKIVVPKRKKKEESVPDVSSDNPIPVVTVHVSKTKATEEENGELTPPETIFVDELLGTAKYLYVKKPSVAGYPSWYSDLCPKMTDENLNWKPGPTQISTQMQITPRLLRLTWDGYPLHFSKKNGWGYLVPGKPLSFVDEDHKDFPLSAIESIAPVSGTSKSKKELSPNGVNLDSIWENIMNGVADPEEELQFWKLVTSESDRPASSKKKRAKSDSGPDHHYGNGPYLDEDIPGCWFFRLPHKDGPENRVGNPLAKDFLNKIEDGTLCSVDGEHTDWALKMNKMTSYWRNAHKRIASQLVVWLKKAEHPKSVTRSEKFDEDERYGAIIPLIVSAGTITRRAVEATWLTASNAYVDRVGSELKAMVQSFPGYHFVGADVDSQELWIAALLGDAHFSGIHGSTALGWMTLQGKKSNGTDMHSKTAATVGISREQAKVMNYGRIYGAGQPFASRLLTQFNHRLTIDEAKSRAQAIYAATKGVRGYILNETGLQLLEDELNRNNCEGVDVEINSDRVLTRKELNKILRNSRSRMELMDIVKKCIWIGGTESPMFNMLEKIAMSPEPETPVLGVKISRALEPAYVMDNFMTSRVNWVVQSSAVDYLHLMLVAMRWIFDTYNIDGRFCISIHDEVRYLVKSEDRYRAALALQITNLLTRAMFAHKLGMNDLPQCVAFFSSVDIDTVLRKEVNLDCQTPSNLHGLEKGYGIPQGEAMDIYSILEKTKNSLNKIQK